MNREELMAANRNALERMRVLLKPYEHLPESLAFLQQVDYVESKLSSASDEALDATLGKAMSDCAISIAVIASGHRASLAGSLKRCRRCQVRSMAFVGISDCSLCRSVIAVRCQYHWKALRCVLTKRTVIGCVWIVSSRRG